MPRDLVDDFLDALKESFFATTQQFTDRIIAEQLNQFPHAAPRSRVKPPKQPKPPKAAKVKREAVRTHYDELEVSPRASAETIRAAYLSLSKRYHPDVAKQKNAAERMKQINAAWTVLQDPEKRKEYDRKIREGR